MHAQKSHMNLVLSLGPSYCVNEPVARRHVTYSQSIGINYIFISKKSYFSFNPAINLQTANYTTTMQYTREARVNQRLLNLTLDVLMRISKRSLLRVGLFFNKEMTTTISITQRSATNGGGYYSYGNSILDRSYFPAPAQAGVRFGWCIPFQLFKREQRFNLTLAQFASPLVESDYTLTKSQVGEDVTILSTNARPTVLIIGLEINLQRKDKPKKDAEED